MVTGMKTFTSLITLVAVLAGVVVPGFVAAGIAVPHLPLFVVGFAVLAVVAFAFDATASVDQIRTGSPTATNYRSVAVPAVAAATAPKPVRRVRAIVEIAA